MENVTRGVYDDMRIWTNEIHRAEPVVCEADTILVEFRRGAKPFYSPDQLARQRCVARMSCTPSCEANRPR